MSHGSFDAALYEQTAEDQSLSAPDADPESGGCPSEKRKGPRSPYQCVQLIAPFDGKHLPSQSDFYKVLCADLSPQGFAFYTNAQPNYPQFIAALGNVPFRFMAAEVRNVRLCREPGRGKYVVGCQFTGRICE